MANAEQKLVADLEDLRASTKARGVIVVGVTGLAGIVGGALAAAPLAFALPVVALAGGAVGVVAGAIERLRKPPPHVVVATRVVPAMRPRPVPAPPPPKPAPPKKATISPAAAAAQAEIAKKDAAVKRAMAMKAAAAHVAFMLKKPRRDAQPADILKYAGSYNLRDLYPEWPWVHETGTKYHADYDFGSSDHVHWYVNGTQGYTHTWGGIDFGRLVGQALDDVDNVLNAAGSVVGPVVEVIPWQVIADGIEAATSTIPILGTAVSDYVATIQTVVEALSGKSLQEISFRSAYNYLMATTPGAAALRPILDPVVEVLVEIINGRVPNPKDAIIAATVDVPAGLPRQLAASLAATVASSLGIH